MGLGNKMDKNLIQNQLEIILKQMKEIKRKHSKANVYYDPEKQEIVISYPLPKDYFKKSPNKPIKEL